MLMSVAILNDSDLIEPGLRRLPMFDEMNSELLEDFCRSAQVQHLPKGATLFTQDSPSEWFFVLISGWVKLFTETMDGDEAVVDILTAGHIVGEINVLEDGVHAFGAVTVEPVTLLRLPCNLLKNAVSNDHKAALAMLRSVSRQRQRQIREIESLTLQNASQRIGCFLLRLCAPHLEVPISLTLPYDKSLIAARLGMKSETFSRALSKLRRETDITVKGAVVSIPDMQILSRYVCRTCSNEYPCRNLNH